MRGTSLGRPLIPFVVAIIVAVFSPAVAASFSYLTEAVNRINNLYREDQTVSPENSANIARTVCNALSQLLRDGDFERTMRTFLDSRLRPNAEDIRKLLSDVAEMDRFVEIESRNLRSVGLSPLATVDALASSISSRTRIDPREINIEKIKMDITRLQEGACRLRDQAIEARQTILIRRGAFGVAFLVADAIGEVVSGGSMTIVAGASVALGVGMITESANALSSSR